MSGTQKVARVATRLVLTVALMTVCGMTCCKTNDGNPGDDPSKGFEKCLGRGDC